MRYAFTLIELILSIVMIAMLFTVVPKIIFAINTNTGFALKKENTNSALSLINYIAKLPWDENETKSSEILITDSLNKDFDCNSSSKTRIGSFSKERNCQNTLKASKRGYDFDDDGFDDIDDYDQRSFTFFKHRKRYKMFVEVNYLNDSNSVFVYDYNNKSAVVNLEKSTPSSVSTNLKEIKITLSEEKAGFEQNITSFSYISTNIGQILIKGLNW